MPRTNEPGRSVSSRLLELLFAFRPDRRAMSLAELVRVTGIPHATARRLVLELVEAGALDRRDDGRFIVGLPLWRLGTLAPRTESLRALAKPFLEDLYAALQQHVQLAVLEGDKAVVIERLSAPHAMGILSRIGGSIPLHCSGVGKVLLSHAGPEYIDRVIAEPLQRFTPHTVTDPDVLRKQLSACRWTGASSVQEEFTPGADSVATRIVDGSGKVVAALAVIVKSGSVRLQAIQPSVVASGLGLSRLLGWRPGIIVRDG